MSPASSRVPDPNHVAAEIGHPEKFLDESDEDKVESESRKLDIDEAKLDTMSAGHLFSALTGGGVYFDKKKYAGDIALFKDGGSGNSTTPDAAKARKEKSKKRASATASSSNISANALPAELDFFGGASTASSSELSQNEKRNSKKRKRDQGDGDDDDGSSDEKAAATAANAVAEHFTDTDGAADSSKKSKKQEQLKTHQRVLYVGAEEGKLHALRQLVLDGEMKPPVLLFVQSVQRAQDLYSELAYDNLRVDVIHQDRTPSHRKSVVDKFRQGQVWVLIATDKMAKMVEPQSCNLVISYDFPQSAQSYSDRIARSGRGGKEGRAVTFFTKEDRPYLKIVVNVMKLSGSTDIPDWLLALPNLSKNEKRKLKRRAPERKDVKDAAGTSTFGRKEAVKRAEMVAGSKRRAKKGREPRTKRPKPVDADPDVASAGED
ncbi:hypothetical protein V8E36_004679 [Tilletia maclaganii]